MSNASPTAILLNIGHALDHLFLLIFANAIAAIAVEFGMSWQDLLPYSVGLVAMFGLGSLPAGRLGDLWGRRKMMLIFFFGMGAASAAVALAEGKWQIGAALTLLGVFTAIYHPVGIPMLMQKAVKPGITIGINGLCGNLGIAAAAVVTGYLIRDFGWRAAFIVPGLVSILCGVVFAQVVPQETEAPAKRKPKMVDLPPSMMMRVFAVMTLSGIGASLVFSTTTNGNTQLFAERMTAIVADPAAMGTLLAVVYAIASLTQLLIGALIDRYPLRQIYLPLVLLQVPLFLLAAQAEGWMLYVVAIGFMALVFGQVPFTEAIIVQYVDDRLRSRVAGTRLAISASVSSLAVWSLGPAVKAAGFDVLLTTLAGVGAVTFVIVLFLPKERPSVVTEAQPLPQPAAGS
ncbi:MAG: MFS transporter [Alphaproteobacteria bacterium]|nr:MFS transporter [Alphaproteobacteria bacterium]